MNTILPTGSKVSRLQNEVARHLDMIWKSSTAPGGPTGFFLKRASALYALGLARDQRRALLRRRSLPVPVLSVGNVTVGGTGKTPFTLWLARHFRQRGFRPAILSRGYGGSESRTGPALVEPEDRDAAVRFGDEPVLMAKRLGDIPVWIGRDRRESGCRAVERSGANILLLDDGFQHIALHRDVDIVLLDAENPFGNGKLLPGGSLREPVRSLERADVFLLTRADSPEAAADTRSLLESLFPGKPIFECTHRITSCRFGLDGPRLRLETLKGRPVVAFAGIAHPESFFKGIETLGMTPVGVVPYPDHHSYGPGDLRFLPETVQELGAQFLVTTEKDAVRLPAPLRDAVLVTELEPAFTGDDEQKLGRWLNGLLESV